MHFLVHVILPKQVGSSPSLRDIDAALEPLLAPHGNVDGQNDDGWWDWYEVGGPFAGAVKPSSPLPAPVPRGLLGRIFPAKPPQNVAPARDVLANWNPDQAPFVLITPDGEAHGAEEWSKEDFAPWEAKFKALLRRYADHLVAGVDCHN